MKQKVEDVPNTYGTTSLLVMSQNRYPLEQLRTTSLYGNTNDVSGVAMETLEADLLHSQRNH